MRKPTPARLSKYWCFTAYEGDECLALTAKSEYIITGREVSPTTGRERFHGYVEFAKKLRLSALKKMAPTTHFGPRIGSRNQAIWDCKKDGNWNGDLSLRRLDQGRRLEDLSLKMKQADSNAVVPPPTYSDRWSQYSRRYDEYRRFINSKGVGTGGGGGVGSMSRFFGC